MCLAQIAFFMHLPEIIGLVTTPSLSDLCLIPETVILRGGFMNIFISAFFHADDWHLYFNTVAFISKVITLIGVFTHTQHTHTHNTHTTQIHTHTHALCDIYIYIYIYMRFFFNMFCNYDLFCILYIYIYIYIYI